MNRAKRLLSQMTKDAKTGRKHCETLIQTELGTYFILDEDLITGQVMARRVTANEAYEYRETAKAQAVPT